MPNDIELRPGAVIERSLRLWERKEADGNLFRVQ